VAGASAAFLIARYKLVGDVAHLASGVTRTARRALKEATDASR
jgi:hypothetical protein